VSYPGEGQIAVWIEDYFNHATKRGMRYEAYLVERACDWQREQDRRICQELQLEREEAFSCEAMGCQACADALASHPPKETP
jgi:hypothetical protein